MASDITIRNMTEDDLREVFLLRQSLPVVLPDEGADARAERIVDAYMKHPNLCYTALRRKRVIGFVMGSVVDADDGKAGMIAMMAADAGGGTARVYGGIFARICAAFAGDGIAVIYAGPFGRGDSRRDVYRGLGFDDAEDGIYMKYVMTGGS